MKRIIISLIGLIGISILLIYPIYGLYYNHVSRTEVLATNKMYSQISDQELDQIKDYWETVTKERDIVDPFNKMVTESIRTEETVLEKQAVDQKSIPLDQLQKDVVGIIRMPSIHEKPMPIYMGSTKEQLKKGIGYVPGTDIPLSGPGSHTVLSGHRGYYGANLFLYIDYLTPGDIIYVNYLGEEAAYRVIGNEIVSANNIEKLTEKPDASEEWLTLLTCHPIPSFKERLLVHAVRVPNELITSHNVTHISENNWKELGYSINSLKVDRIFNVVQNKEDSLVDVLPKQGIMNFFVTSFLQEPTLLYEIILIFGCLIWLRFFYLLIRNIIILSMSWIK